MKKLALIMVIISFLAGAYLTVLDPREVNWNWMIPVLLFGVIGLVLSRKADKQEAQEGTLLAGNIGQLGKNLSNIHANLKLMCANKEEIPTYEARFEIDRLFREDLIEFAEARESMVHVFGMQNYADVMSNFAAGERYLNRIWSASTDGYVDEVNEYLDRALAQFSEALEHYNGLQEKFADRAEQPAT